LLPIFFFLSPPLTFSSPFLSPPFDCYLSDTCTQPELFIPFGSLLLFLDLAAPRAPAPPSIFPLPCGVGRTTLSLHSPWTACNALDFVPTFPSFPFWPFRPYILHFYYLFITRPALHHARLFRHSLFPGFLFFSPFPPFFPFSFFFSAGYPHLLRPLCFQTHFFP